METTPEPPPTAAQIAEQARKAQRDRAESAFLSHLAGTDRVAVVRRAHGYRASNRGLSRRDPREDRCRTAKARRENTLRTVGLDRTFDLLRRLDDEVIGACRRG